MAIVETYREGKAGLGRDKTGSQQIAENMKKGLPLLDFGNFYTAVCTGMAGKWAKLLYNTNPNTSQESGAARTPATATQEDPTVARGNKVNDRTLIQPQIYAKHTAVS